MGLTHWTQLEKRSINLVERYAIEPITFLTKIEWVLCCHFPSLFLGPGKNAIKKALRHMPVVFRLKNTPT